jgi:tetratricopeptide (TPR) repeat protein
MNIICYGISIIVLITVTETYAMNPKDFCSGQPDARMTLSGKKGEGNYDFWDEAMGFTMRRGRAYFGLSNDPSFVNYRLAICEKAIGDSSNTPDDLANIYVHLGAARYQLGHYYEALKDFQMALSIKDSKGYSMLMEEGQAQVLRHIAIIFEKVGAVDEAALVYESALEKRTPTGFALSPLDRSNISSRLSKIREMNNRNTLITLPEDPYQPPLEKMRIDYLLNDTDEET